MYCSQHIKELRETLNMHFHWNKARITCFTNILVGLFLTRTVNLTSIAVAFEGDAKRLSRYRRIQRFFSGYEIDYKVIAKFIFGIFGFQEIYLTLDRTNWKWGKSNINILTLGIVYKGIAIPIIWKLLDKYGNSDTPERIEIMKIFISYFGKACIKGLLADREFKGKTWFTWLIGEKIPFYIRIAKNTVTSNSRGLSIDIDGLFYDVKVGEERILIGKRNLWGLKVYISGTRAPDGELVLIATNDNLEQALKIYRKRWEIETLFQCLKGRGFNFEDTHIIDLDRIKKMVALLTIAFCWAHKTGEWYHTEVEPIIIKKHGRPAYSIFRYGLDLIREGFFKVIQKIELFRKCLIRLVPNFGLQPIIVQLI